MNALNHKNDGGHYAYTKDFFEKAADRIAADLAPGTVLHAGCGRGDLVAALRDRGIEAYGVDISEYAVAHVRADLRTFCFQGSLSDPLPAALPKQFDLIVAMEAMEQSGEEDIRKAVGNLCRLTDTVIFCPISDDDDAKTRLDIQPRDDWAVLFAENGFFDSLSYRHAFLTEDAVCYRKGESWLCQLQNYERYIARMEQALAQKQAETEAIMALKNELEAQKNNEQARYAELAAHYQEILECTCWKMTKPIRVVGTAVKDVLKRHRATRLLYRGCSSLMHEGPAVTMRRIKTYLDRKGNRTVGSETLSPKQVKAQRRTRFSKDIQFSILVPLYNTPEQFLIEMIQSVKNQTYGKWELCMADGSDEAHQYVEAVCRGYQAADKRIRYHKLERNLGISGNTNACLDMADGDYVVLLDHDDLLHPAALFEAMKAICEKDADFIYTDENTFRNTPADAFCPHFKPDFSPDTLRSYHYIGHLSVFSSALVEQIGRFRSEFDGSQDYDMILRLTEKAQHIVHIPKILYYWRSSSGSVAQDSMEKPYAVEAAKKALSEHLKRVGLDGEVTESSVPSTYHIQYRLNTAGLVSIVIPNKDHVDDLDQCIRSIIQKTTYPNWEIIIVENNSTERSTFDYYQKIQADHRIRVITWMGIFNYSAITNFGMEHAKGEYLLLLNNDVEIITPDWLEQMLMFAQRRDVGAVGSMLYYPGDTVQHAGVIVGLGGVAGHSHRYCERGSHGYMARMSIAQNLSAVTAACLLTRKDVWENVNGLDERFQVAFNDVDLCMRIREAGYLIVWTPYAELYHYESKSRGLDDTPEKQKRYFGEIERFQTRWKKQLEAGDPYYNPNLSLDREDFSVKQ